MRDIKFRAWWPEDKIMTYVFSVDFAQGGILVGDGCWHQELIGEKCKLMQYTGLDDKNGKEIYEGDIFKAPHDYGPAGWVEQIGTVSFKKKTSC